MAVKEHLPREIKSAQTQKKIIDTSISILAKYDFKYLTVRNICDEAEVAYGSFYHHFKTKENVLLFCGKELLSKNIEANLFPAEFDQEDYLHICIWYAIIIALFCDYLGKDFVRTIFLNNEGSNDLFENVYKDFMFPALESAAKNGFIRVPALINVTLDELLDRTKKDVQIVTRGTVLWWCCSDEGGKVEPFAETMEHMIYHTLVSSQSDKARLSNNFGLRLHETKQFANIKIVTFDNLVK